MATDRRNNEKSNRTPQSNPSSEEGWPRWIASLILIVVVSSGMLSIRAVADAATAVRGKSLLQGEWTRAFEDTYADGLRFRSISQSLWGLFRFTVFHEGTDGVLVADGNWLFTTEEYEGSGTSLKDMRYNAELIASVRDRLELNGIELIVALIPAKARIYEESAPFPLPPSAQERYVTFRELLIDRDINVPDLAAPMTAAKKGEPVFLRTDTHWTPFGADVTAEAIGNAVHSIQWNPPLPAMTSTLVSEEPLSLQGDLIPFLSLGSFEGRIGPGEEIIVPYRAEVYDTSALGLFDTPDIPVAVVGTSYSADPRWSFTESLKAALQTDVLSVAERGEGPYAPMISYLEGETFAEIPPRLIIWEIPERYVDDPWDRLE